MPWKVFQEDGQYCVHKETEDGGKGEKVACHDTEAEAQAQVRALYASENKALDVDTEPDEVKAGRRLAGAKLKAARDAVAALDELVRWAAYEDGQPDDSEAEPMSEKTLVTVGNELKALGDGKVGGYLVRFGTPDMPDLTGDYFTADTEFDLDDGAGKSTVLYHHGMDAKIGRRKIGRAVLQADDVGVWMEAQLKLRDEYEQAIYGMVEAGKMGLSSGTAPHLVERERTGNIAKITRWPLGLDASITPIPAEPRTSVTTLKSYLDMAEPYVKALLPQADGETAAADATNSQPEPEQTNLKEPDEVKTMDNEQVQAMIDAAVAKATESTTKAIMDKLAAEPAINPATVATKPAEVKDSRPQFKSFGEFLHAVARAETHGVREDRLMAVKSGDPLDENGYDVSKAMGAGFVGSLYRKSAMKAPSGLGEQIASDGGYLVTQDRQGGILSRVYDIGQLLQRVAMTPISANSNGLALYAEDETSRANGSRRGGVQAYWRAEAATVTASAPNFREMNLKLNSLMGIVYATDELLADAIALEAYINDKLPEELRFKAEDAIVNGTGANMPLGFLNSGAVITVDEETGQAADTVVAENIWKMYSRMWAPSIPRAVWLISQDVWPQLFQLSLAVGTGGVGLFLPPGGMSSAPYGTLLGRPVLPVEYADKLGDANDIMFVDLSQYQMISKGGVQADSSMHVRFLYGENTFRFIYRVDGQPTWNSALTPFNGGATVSPFISLAERA